MLTIKTSKEDRKPIGCLVDDANAYVLEKGEPVTIEIYPGVYEEEDSRIIDLP